MTLSKRRKILLGGTPDEIRALFAADAANRRRDPAGPDLTAAQTAAPAAHIVPERLRDLYDALHDPRLSRDPDLQRLRVDINTLKNDAISYETARNTPANLRSTLQELALQP